MEICARTLIRRKLRTWTSIHAMALDGIFNANSLFTVALFLGLTTTVAGGNKTTLHGRRCAATSLTAMAERLVSSHVYSFSCFLFSSLIALALKQAMETTTAGGEEEEEAAARGVNGGHRRVNLAALRVGILVSSIGSVLGCGFLTAALVDLVQIRLGPLECSRSFDSLAAIVPLVTLVPSALVIHVLLVLYAFTR